MSDYDDFEEEEYQSEASAGTMKRIGSLLKPHTKRVAAFLTAIFASAIMDALFTFISMQIIDQGINRGDRDALTRFVGIYGGLIVVQAMTVFLFIYLVGILGEKIRYELRQKMFNHLQTLSLSYFSRRPVGWIMARVTSDSDRVADLMTWAILDVSWAIVSMVSSAYFMFRINWRLAAITLVIVPILLVVAVYFRKRILVQYRKVRKINSKITGSYNENIQGVRVVKALGREDANLREFGELTGEMYAASFRAAWLSALFLPAVQMISALALVAVAIIGGQQMSIGGMTIGGIQAFISYITFMMWPVQDLARVYAEMQHAIASAERIFSLLDSQPEVRDLPGAVDPGTVRGDIVFDHVDFYYEDEKAVLRDFSIEVKQGQMIALVGPTGGGKTTIVNLLCRFYEPRRGKISIGGRDYRELELNAIQSRIGIVLQTPHLFSGSIRENIRYGRLDASDVEIEQAARTAGAHDFIMAFVKGYDQEVGEGGNLLSVGQKQLISLARAMLANPEIFIMDEATSSVDTLTESLIQRGMENMMKGRTSFIIAHRLSTIRRADKILVIEGGTISEMGSHAELMRARGHYYRLYTQQFRRQLEAEYNPYASVPEPAE